MSYYKEKSKAPTIILWVLIALVTAGLIAMIVVGFVRSQRQDDVPELKEPPVESNEQGTEKNDSPEPDIPTITPGTEPGAEEPEPPEETTESGHVSVDILEQNKENEKENNPHIVGEPSVLPGVKEAGNETNN